MLAVTYLFWDEDEPDRRHAITFWYETVNPFFPCPTCVDEGRQDPAMIAKPATRCPEHFIHKDAFQYLGRKLYKTYPKRFKKLD